MKKVRVIYESDGLTRFISHLDLSRVMQFALRRSDLPVWYTEGFHQHLYLTFSNPLSLGFINRYGIMEFKLTDDGFDVSKITDILNACVPNGIFIKDSYESERKFTDIAFSDYLVTGICASQQRFNEGMHAENIIITKRGKAGEREVDIAPYIRNLCFSSEGDTVTFSFRLPCHETFSVNPGALIDAVEQKSGVIIERKRIERTNLLDADGKIFR